MGLSETKSWEEAPGQLGLGPRRLGKASTQLVVLSLKVSVEAGKEGRLKTGNWNQLLQPGERATAW